MNARPSPLAAWVAACRPRTLAAGAVPVFVGSALAHDLGAFRPGPALAALVGALAIQVGTNLANDLFDARKGADTPDRVGPARAVAQGWLTPRQVAAGTGVALGIAALCGISLVAAGGWPILALGLASIVLALAYTGGPFPLAYHGLGDLFVLLFFGFGAVVGTTWVQALAAPPAAWLAGASVGLLATAILVVNNLRDRHTDARAGKRTLAVRLGARAARIEYAICVGAALAAPPLGVALGWADPPWLLSLAALPLAVAEVRGVWVDDGPALNPRLGRTARLELVHGLLLAAGIVL